MLDLFSPLSVAEIVPLTFSRTPAWVAMTSTWAVQLAPAAREAPFGLPNISVVAPAEGDQVGLPLQVVLALGVGATCKPLGRGSVNRMPVRASFPLWVLLMVKVNRVHVLRGIREGVKDLLMVGGGGREEHPVNFTSSK